MIFSCMLLTIAVLALSSQESSKRCLSPGNLRAHALPPFVNENTYPIEITQNTEAPLHDPETEYADDGVGVVKNPLPADLQGLLPHKHSEPSVDAIHDTLLSEEESLQLVQDSLFNALADDKQLHQENEELNRQVKLWRERGKQVMKSLSIAIANSNETGEEKTNDEVKTPSSLLPIWLQKPIMLFAWGIQAPQNLVSTVANESTHVSDTLRPFMDTRGTFACFMIVVLLVLFRHKNFSKSSLAWSKLQALGPVFRRVAMSAHSVQIAEIYVGGMPNVGCMPYVGGMLNGGALRLTIQAGLTRTETKEIEDVEGFFVRFPGTFTFSLKKSDKPCHFSVIADENVIAYAEISANDLVELAQRPQEYHQAALILNRHTGVIHNGVRSPKPYVAMRIRDVTFSGIRRFEAALPGK